MYNLYIFKQQEEDKSIKVIKHRNGMFNAGKYLTIKEDGKARFQHDRPISCTQDRQFCLNNLLQNRYKHIRWVNYDNFDPFWGLFHFGTPYKKWVRYYQKWVHDTRLGHLT